MVDEAMRILHQGDPSDTRFQFEVIKNLSESVRQSVEATRDVAKNVSEMQRTQVSMLERLARLESNRVNEQVAKVEERLESACKAIDKLEQDKDRRDGAAGLLSRIPGWLQFAVALASIFSAIYLFGRSAGVIPSPPTTVTKIEAPAAPARPLTNTEGP